VAKTKSPYHSDPEIMSGATVFVVAFAIFAVKINAWAMWDGNGLY
jgi:hypothetical protein